MSTAAEREARFQEHLARSVPYFAAVRAAGDLPWFEDPDKLARLESNCPGITEAPGIEAQRMLFMRRYETRTA